MPRSASTDSFEVLEVQQESNKRVRVVSPKGSDVQSIPNRITTEEQELHKEEEPSFGRMTATRARALLNHVRFLEYTLAFCAVLVAYVLCLPENVISPLKESGRLTHEEHVQAIKNDPSLQTEVGEFSDDDLHREEDEMDLMFPNGLSNNTMETFNYNSTSLLPVGSTEELSLYDCVTDKYSSNETKEFFNNHLISLQHEYTHDEEESLSTSEESNLELLKNTMIDLQVNAARVSKFLGLKELVRVYNDDSESYETRIHKEMTMDEILQSKFNATRSNSTESDDQDVSNMTQSFSKLNSTKLKMSLHDLQMQLIKLFANCSSPIREGNITTSLSDMSDFFLSNAFTIQFEVDHQTRYIIFNDISDRDMNLTINYTLNLTTFDMEISVLKVVEAEETEYDKSLFKLLVSKSNGDIMGEIKEIKW